MTRDILFIKNTRLFNTLLKTGVCENKGRWILQCEDTKENMKKLQEACSELVKGTSYRSYKLCFANSNNYRDIITV